MINDTKTGDVQLVRDTLTEAAEWFVFSVYTYCTYYTIYIHTTYILCIHTVHIYVLILKILLLFITLRIIPQVAYGTLE